MAKANVLGLLFLALVVKGSAFQFKVGGPNGWAPPSDPNSNSHNQWAEKNRFKIGDSLLFEYSGNSDSVLYVTKDDFDNCKTDNPVNKYTDGHTVFTFEHSGPHYFISGVKDNCLKNEKLVVVVLAPRASAPAPSNDTETSPPSPTPASSPSPPAPAPTSEGSPPPPSGSEPTPAPSQESTPPPPHKKNGASSMVAGFIGTMGAFAGSSFLLLL